MEPPKKRALVIGMARSGVAAARLLYENGYDVTINDMKNEDRRSYGGAFRHRVLPMRWAKHRKRCSMESTLWF